MASPVEIINSAFVNLSANSINAFDEESNEANLANQVWDIERKALLSLHYWNFAIKEVELAENVTAPLLDYKHKYTLPADCLRIVKVYNDPDYKEQSGSIHTNQTTCKIRYVSDNTDTATWPAYFVDVMIARLSQKLSYAITQSTTNRQHLTEEYLFALKQAKYLDASQDVLDRLSPYDSSLVAARY